MPKNTRTKWCRVTCPKCHEAWAEFVYNEETGEVDPKDVKVIKGPKKRFKEGEALACTLCGYAHTTWDIFLAIGESNQK